MALIGALAAGLVGRVRLRPLLCGTAAAALCGALLFGGWTARNVRVLGEPVVTRSNLGLELAIANHAGAVRSDSPERTFHDRLAAIHPAASVAGRDGVTAMGEVAYARKLQRATTAWMVAHPRETLILIVRHAGQFLFPRPWQFYFTGWEGMRAERAGAIGGVVLLGIVGLGMGIRRRRRLHIAVGVFVALLTAQFALFQPMPRYTFLVFAPLAYPATEALRALLAPLWRRMRKIGQASHLAPTPDHRIEDQSGEQA